MPVEDVIGIEFRIKVFTNSAWRGGETAIALIVFLFHTVKAAAHHSKEHSGEFGIREEMRF